MTLVGTGSNGTIEKTLEEPVNPINGNSLGEQPIRTVNSFSQAKREIDSEIFGKAFSTKIEDKN